MIQCFCVSHLPNHDASGFEQQPAELQNTSLAAAAISENCDYESRG